MKLMTILLGLFATLTFTSFTATSVKQDCISREITGEVIANYGCYYSVDTGSNTALVPVGGVTLTVGQCYDITYYNCKVECGNGAITSASPAPCI